jgi:hypothetical protein
VQLQQHQQHQQHQQQQQQQQQQQYHPKVQQPSFASLAGFTNDPNPKAKRTARVPSDVGLIAGFAAKPSFITHTVVPKPAVPKPAVPKPAREWAPSVQIDPESIHVLTHVCHSLPLSALGTQPQPHMFSQSSLAAPGDFHEIRRSYDIYD